MRDDPGQIDAAVRTDDQVKRDGSKPIRNGPKKRSGDPKRTAAPPIGELAPSAATRPDPRSLPPEEKTGRHRCLIRCSAGVALPGRGAIEPYEEETPNTAGKRHTLDPPPKRAEES